MFVQKTSIKFDIGKILEDYNRIFPKYFNMDDLRQIALTSRENSKDPYFESIGKENPKTEIEFPILNDIFKNTYFEKIFNTVGEIGRIRFMSAKPRNCYSIHRDWEKRYHLAIITNPNSYLLEKVDEKYFRYYHIPVDGYLYLVDTIKCHSAANFGQTNRIHLVFNINSTRANE